MLGVIPAGELKRNLHSCSPGVGRNQALGQRRLVKRYVLDLCQLGIRQAFRMANQIRHGQVIAVGLSVLEVGDGVDPDGMGDLPGLFGQFLDDPQSLAGEDVFVLRLDHKEDVVGLGVGILKRFISEELGVFWAEPHSEVGGCLKISYP